MGRPRKQNPEPFWRSERGCYFVQLGKKQVRLSPDKDEAYRLWHEMMAKPPEQRAAVAAAAGDLQAVEVLDLFLDWCQKNRAGRTYEAHKYYSQILAAALPDDLAASDIKPFHLTRAMDAQAGWGNNTKHNFVTAINRSFNWALKQQLIDKNPVAFTEKPAREARELATTPADYAEVMAAIKEPNFRELVDFSWETGIRPQEVRIIEARHVDFDQARIVFPPKESKGKKKHRVVYLTDRGAAILEALVEKHPTGPAFRNSEGNAWTKDAINCAFCRLEEKIGRKLHLGAFRKGYCTEALKNGVDTNTVAHLMGHANGVMIAKIYAKVQQDPVFMAQSAKRAKGVAGGGA